MIETVCNNGSCTLSTLNSGLNSKICNRPLFYISQNNHCCDISESFSSISAIWALAVFQLYVAWWTTYFYILPNIVSFPTFVGVVCNLGVIPREKGDSSLKLADLIFTHVVFWELNLCKTDVLAFLCDLRKKFEGVKWGWEGGGGLING